MITKRMFTGNAREDELINVLHDLIGKIKLDGKEFVSSGTHPSSLALLLCSIISDITNTEVYSRNEFSE